MKLRLGTRGSALALAQARLVQSRLQSHFPSLEVEIVPIKTTGDKLSEAFTAGLSAELRGPGASAGLTAPQGKGVFIKEIEEALFDKRVDLAVHSLKDLPADLAAGLALGAVLEREDPRDCVISRFGEQLLELPRGAAVGTSSPRRQAQIRAAKKSIRLEEMRGNLDTRIRKVLEGQVDAIVVAHAGVKRLGRQEEVSEVLPFDLMLPAPGQGFITVEIRADDRRLAEFVSSLDHGPSARAARAERAFLAALGGGCRVPIAAHAREEAGRFVIDGLVISSDGGRSARGNASGDPALAETLGAELGKKLLAEGGADILGPRESPSETGFGS